MLQTTIRPLLHVLYIRVKIRRYKYEYIIFYLTLCGVFQLLSLNFPVCTAKEYKRFEKCHFFVMKILHFYLMINFSVIVTNWVIKEKKFIQIF